MQHLVKVTDAANTRMVLLTVSELEASQPAIDVVFDLLGIDDLSKLTDAGILPEGQLDDMKALQEIIFDHDDQGALIRDGVNFTANGADLNPDLPLSTCLREAERNGIPYKMCSLVVSSPEMLGQIKKQQMAANAAQAAAASAPQSSTADKSAQPVAGNVEKDPMAEFALIMLLHQLGIGNQIDVTKDFPEITEEIALCEKNSWIDIDVQKASYRLTEQGQAARKRYLDEAQDLIKRYDIYGDVDVDGSGIARFDTNLGKDLRVAAWEFEGVDPFRARFLLGINDGEWNNLSNWMELVHEKSWYDGIFDPIESAASVDDIGATRMQSVIDQGKTALRKEQDAARYSS